MSVPQFLYIFDPLCGWCYASAPALSALARTWPHSIELLPSGLFSGAGARALTPDWANYAWANDQRIAAMTKQVFSEAYYRGVLLGANGRFDSALMSRALTAVRALDPQAEPRLLDRLQVARYVEGRDTAMAHVVAAVAADVASNAGQPLDPVMFASRLKGDPRLVEETDARIYGTQLLMSRLGLRGVPQLLVRVDGATEVVDSQALYQEPRSLIVGLRNRFAKALAATRVV